MVVVGLDLSMYKVHFDNILHKNFLSFHTTVGRNEIRKQKLLLVCELLFNSSLEIKVGGGIIYSLIRISMDINKNLHHPQSNSSLESQCQHM